MPDETGCKPRHAFEQPPTTHVSIEYASTKHCTPNMNGRQRAGLLTNTSAMGIGTMPPGGLRTRSLLCLHQDVCEVHEKVGSGTLECFG